MPKLKPIQRLIVDFPNEGLAILDDNLHCNCCDCHVIWTHKSDILKHIQTDKHGKAKKRQLTNDLNQYIGFDRSGDGDSSEGTSHSQQDVNCRYRAAYALLKRRNGNLHWVKWCKLARRKLN